MEVLLIRHGESEADLIHVHEGSADFPLTKRGLWQVAQMAERVATEFPPEKIWSSTLQRASKTAEILAQHCRCPVTYECGLREQDNGDLAGKPLAEVAPPINLLPHEKMGRTGESALECRLRAETIWAQIKQESEPHARIAIVSHEHAFKALVKRSSPFKCSSKALRGILFFTFFLDSYFGAAIPANMT